MGKLAKKPKDQELIYPFEIRSLSEEDGGGYLITFPDIPGCMSDGKTPEEAIENGRDALWCVLKVYEEEGKPFPRLADQYSGKFVQRVPKSVHSRLESTAAREGVSINTLVQNYISYGLGLASTRQKAGVARPRIAKKRTQAKRKIKTRGKGKRIRG